jgi:ribosomal protein S18 acetylase RimI-like enzyme
VIQTQVCVRTAREADAEAVRAFLAGLSFNTQYQRFFTGLGSVSPSLVRELVSASARRHNAIAVRGAEVVGHAMAATNRSGDVEIGVVVADDHQRQGIGTSLIRTLLAEAFAAGADQLRMDVLTENQLVLDWIRRSFPEVEFERDGYTLIAHTPLSPAMIALPAA